MKKIAASFLICLLFAATSTIGEAQAKAHRYRASHGHHRSTHTGNSGTMPGAYRY